MLKTSNLRGIISMVLAGVTFVSCDSFLKLLVRETPPLEALVLRGIAASLWCFLLVLAMGHGRQLTRAFSLWIVLRALAEVCAVVAFIIALAHVKLGDITAIYQAAPLIVLAGASFVWGEQVGPLRWLLIVVGLAGALLVAQPGGAGTSAYALLGFITAFASALRDLLSRRTPHDIPGIVVTFTVVVCVLAAATLGSLTFETWVPVTAQMAFYAMGAGFFVMLGQLFVFLAFRHATARSVAPFYYSFTLFAVTFGAVFFGEFPNHLAILGILMIIACGLGVLAFEGKDKAA
jgi:drug/metabolite transporter (DMT)-like permease